jgi:hypothetical protein
MITLWLGDVFHILNSLFSNFFRMFWSKCRPTTPISLFYFCVLKGFFVIVISASFRSLTRPQHLAKRVFHRVRSSASSFNVQCTLFSESLFSSCLRLLPRLPIAFIHPSISPLITCFTGQFLCNMWPIQLAFRLVIVRRIFLYLTVCNTSSFFYTIGPTDLLHSSPAPHFETFLSVYLILSIFRGVTLSASYNAMLQM